jgi:hypothetical protein
MERRATRRTQAVSLRTGKPVSVSSVSGPGRKRRRAEPSGLDKYHGVKLGKLEMATLKRYQAHFMLHEEEEDDAVCSKSALVRMAERHFEKEPKLKESTVIAEFLNKIRDEQIPE